MSRNFLKECTTEKIEQIDDIDILSQPIVLIRPAPLSSSLLELRSIQCVIIRSKVNASGEPYNLLPKKYKRV
jgi:hypothetical protein